MDFFDKIPVKGYDYKIEIFDELSGNLFVCLTNNYDTVKHINKFPGTNIVKVYYKNIKIDEFIVENIG